MRRAIPILFVVALLLGALVLLRTPADAPPVVTLNGDISAIRDAFNRDVGNVRLLLLVDPT